MSEPVPSVAPAQTNVVIQPAQPYKPCCNPCPCMTLQCGAKTIAILEIVSCTFSLFIAILTLVFREKINDIYREARESNNATYPRDVNIPVVAGWIGDLMLTLLFAVFLLLGANQLNRAKCCVWFIGTTFFLFLGVILAIAYAILAGGGALAIGVTIGAILVVGLIAWYFIYVVWAFMQELKYNYRPFPITDPEEVVVRRVQSKPDAAADAPGTGQ